MAADWTLKQGDTEPGFLDTLTYSDGSAADLTGATVTFVMRSLTSPEPLELTGTTSITGPTFGTVEFAPSVEDSATPGMYMASWLVTFSDGSRMTFPTVGYLWVSIEDNLTTTGGAQLVGLPDVKDYLNLPADDRTHDAKLMRFINAIRPTVEHITGPILPRVVDEWHDGGQPFVMLRRRPSTAYGTSPILTLASCDEYRASQRFQLDIVATPAAGSMYSCMLETTGRVVRRTAGGGVTAFPAAPQSVHVIYTAGQEVVPPNVYEGTLELIRVNYQTTQQVGRGRRTVTDDTPDPGPALGFFVPRRVRELLAPNRRAPSVA